MKRKKMTQQINHHFANHHLPYRVVRVLDDCFGCLYNLVDAKTDEVVLSDIDLNETLKQSFRMTDAFLRMGITEFLVVHEKLRLHETN